VKEYREVQTDKEVVESLLGKVRQKDMKALRVIVEHFVSKD
jgi:hypothetical protein